MDAPPIMTVYDGQTALGTIQDYGAKRGVLACILNPHGNSTSLGFFTDRRAGMRAVSAAAEARKRLAEPAPFKSGLPE